MCECECMRGFGWLVGWLIYFLKAKLLAFSYTAFFPSRLQKNFPTTLSPIRLFYELVPSSRSTFAKSFPTHHIPLLLFLTSYFIIL